MKGESYQSPSLSDTLAEEPCTECALPCAEETCIVEGITPQCTDQCMLLHCDDPDHGMWACSDEHEYDEMHCEQGCDEEVDCADCRGVDNFVSATSLHFRRTKDRTSNFVRLNAARTTMNIFLNLAAYPQTLPMCTLARTGKHFYVVVALVLSTKCKQWKPPLKVYLQTIMVRI